MSKRSNRRYLIGRRSGEVDVPTPGVEVGGVGLDVVGVGQAAMRVEDELVGREEDVAEEALDALGPRRVVARRQEGSAAAPRAQVTHVEREILRQFRRTVIAYHHQFYSLAVFSTSKT